MAQQEFLREIEARQIAEETALIDHLVQTFPFELAPKPDAQYILRSEAVLNLIRGAGSRNI
jgi:hypothetical protein